MAINEYFPNAIKPSHLFVLAELPGLTIRRTTNSSVKIAPKLKKLPTTKLSAVGKP
jgi:hypothetical protein